MNPEQQYLRDKVNDIIKKYGIKANHICAQTHIDTAYFSRWRNGKRYLDSVETQAIKTYLNQFSF